MSKKGKLLNVLRRLACNSVEQQDSPSVPLVWRSGRRAVSPQAGCSPCLASQGAADMLCKELKPCWESLSMAPCESDGGLEGAQEQLQLLLRRECLDITDADWLVVQAESIIEMRRRLVGWLQVAAVACHQYSIITLEHATNFLDRFLFKTKFLGGRVREAELAAVAAFSLAAKMEEVFVPSLADELQMGAPWKRFKPAEIEAMELVILKALGWRLACITPCDLVQPMLEANAAWRLQLSLPAAGDKRTTAGQAARTQRLGSQIRRKATGLLATAAADPHLTQFRASEIAAASLVVSVHSTCPDSLAYSIQATLLARFPKAGACLPTLLQHCTLPCGVCSPDSSSSPTAVTGSHNPDTGSESSCDSPAAKRCCRALTPTSVLDM